MQSQNIVLTITGSDSIGESGIQADIRTITSLGGRAVSAITSVTVQNTVGIQQFYDIPATLVEGQVEAVMNDVAPDVVKIGMIRRTDVLDVIVAALLRYRPRFIIFDPVITSSRGEQLMDEAMATRIRQSLLPLCSLIILKKGDIDYLLANQVYDPDKLLILDDSKPSLHGQTTCFSSAMATFISQGLTVKEATQKSNDYINRLILKAENLEGRSHELYNDFLDVLAQHYRNRSDVQFYADRLNVSSRYLAQVCRRVCGKAPKSIIDDKVVEEIKNLLSNTTQSVQEIANALGFTSQAHLSRFFRKMTGITPREYRSS